MFDISLRQWKDRCFRPTIAFVPSWVTPGQVTFTALIAGLFACAAATNPAWTWSAVSLWLANRALDCLDGVLARERHHVSELGGFCDLLSDFIIYSLIPMSVAYGQSVKGHMSNTGWLIVAFLEASFHVNNFVLFYCAAVAAKKDDDELTSVTMKPALVEGFEAGMLFTAMLVWPQRLVALSALMSLGVAMGTVQRVTALVEVFSHIDARAVEKHVD